MSEILEAVFVGIVQGLTEFLPISSSAHLTLLPPLLGWDDAMVNSASFVVMLHLGTLLALLGYFWRDVIVLVRAGIDSLRERSLAGDPNRRLAWLLVISVVPAAIVGALFESFFDTWFRERLLAIPLILVVGAALLWLAERYGRRDRDLDHALVGDAVVIGAAQALALFPGISRSGITLAAGLFRGLQRESAARFAFLMGIPIIAGAGIWKLRAIASAPPGSIDWPALLAGMAAAAITGWLAIGWLLRYLRTNTTAIFIYYRLCAAAVLLVLLVIRG